jgi:hypothetical protein
VVTEHAGPAVEYVIGGAPTPLFVDIAAGTGGVLVNNVFPRAGNVIVSVAPRIVRFTVTGVAAAKFPAAGCVTVTEHAPGLTGVTTPVALTVQAGLDVEYVGGKPEVVVAPIVTGVPYWVELGTVDGTVITSASGFTVISSLTGVAAA